MARDFLSELGLEVDMFGPNRRDEKTVSRLGSFATLMYVEHKRKDKKDPYVRRPKRPVKADHKDVRIDQLNGYQDITNTTAADQSARSYQGIGPHPVLEESNYFIEQDIPDGQHYNAIILNDAGDELRQPAAQELVHKAFSHITKPPLAGGQPKFVLVKMHLPLLKGCVWQSFKESAEKNKDVPHVVVVSADDLRASDVEINHCLSWDAVIDDIAKAVAESEQMQALLEPGCHLIVVFDVEGAVCLQKANDRVEWSIAFCPPRHEGMTTALNAGTLVGKMNCFTAYLCKEMLEGGANLNHASLREASTRALTGLRAFAVKPMQIEGTDDGGLGQLRHPELKHLVPNRPESVHSEPEESKCDCLPVFTYDYWWQPLEDIIVNSYERRPASHLIEEMYDDGGPERLAKDIIRKGLGALNAYPVGKFGKLTAVDRSEIESLRAISRLISNYLSNHNETVPLSIAVFGAPGAGKSFSVKQLVDEDEVPICEFNLSEATAQDLPGFFHEIRDYNLTGKVPLCFFDEFDTEGRKLVASFLAPMQDGKFRQGSRIHPTGRGIFVFAGGTSQTFEEFTGQTEENAQNEAELNERNRQLKIPDFSSRLRGYLNIGGIDTSERDTHLLRRAILLRFYLEEHMPSIIDQDKVAQIEGAVIDAFLGCNSYVHGARSMEQIVKMSSRSRAMTRFTLSDLPEDRQLVVHVGEEKFKNMH